MVRQAMHPGKYILEEHIKPRGLTVTEAAKVLDVTRNTLSRLLNGRHGVSAVMAVRLAIAFGETPETWMKRQMAYDLARAREDVDVRSIARLGPIHPVDRSVVRKHSLQDRPVDTDFKSMTAAERFAMMWPLTRDVWAFKGAPDAEPRLPRHTVHIRRSGG